MRKRFFDLAAAVSLSLCVGTSFLSLRNRSSVELLAAAYGHWVGPSSIYRACAVSLGAGGGRIAVGCSRWGFDFSHVNELTPGFGGPSNPLQYRLRNPNDLTFVDQQCAINEKHALLPDHYGFACDGSSARSNAAWVDSRALTVPAWLLMLLTSLPPARWMIKAAPHLRHPRQRLAHLCVAIVNHFAPDQTGRLDPHAGASR